LVETDKGGLVAKYAGQTSQKTQEVFRSALGGVLFIDEAYTLSQDGGNFGREAIDTLIKLIEDYRGEIVVILAGYKAEMKEFLKANTGLKSRFPLEMEFPDYTAIELFNIALSMIKARGFVLRGKCDDILNDAVIKIHRHADASSGNGRMMRNFVDEIIRKQSVRIAISDVAESEMNIVIADDIISDKKLSQSYDLENELSKVIGVNDVKKFIRSLNAKLRLQCERKKQGLIVDHSQTLHMIFKGSSGTGKTMMARIIADTLYNIGVLKTNKLIETDRAGLVAGYVGQTALKTKAVVIEALDGVLFIDEAYALSKGGENDYGREAIDTLVKMIDDNRERLVVILAGYNNDMDNFLTMNAGLKSRFPNIIEFEEYNTDELFAMSNNLFASNGYILTEGACGKLKEILGAAIKNPVFGNGRYVRNLFERSVNNQSLRLNSDHDLTKGKLATIEESDIEMVS
jgi:AAA+ superfamily predicted ATPase